MEHNSILPTPWNKGKLTGAKPSLLARHVWSIWTRLQIQGRTRDMGVRVHRKPGDSPASGGIVQTRWPFLHARGPDRISGYCLATRSWKVRSAILASTSMMRLPSLSKWKSEMPGQSRHALPDCYRRLAE
jgi:hypothetical protein